MSSAQAVSREAIEAALRAALQPTAIEVQDDSHLHIDIAEVLTGLRRGRGEWEADVPEGVAQRIIEQRLLGYDTE